MKKINFTLYFLLVFITAIQAQNVQYLPLYTDATFSRSVNTNLPVGYTAGSLDVSPTGGATYSIPIALPPGTKGVVPSVSIAYSSQGGNGMMGMGWNIAASSSISRTGKNQLYDSEITPVKLNSEDLYALDGNRLEVTSGNYGADASQYATKMETFSKITANGNILGCPQWFKVETKGGMVYEYGNTADSRLMTEDNTKIISWQLNKTYDQYGNYMEYVYEMNGREMRIKEIRYTGNTAASITPYNKVKFNYLDRTDKKTLYTVGSAITMNSLLTEMVVTTEGDAQVRKFAFNYSLDDLNQSFLTEVTEYGSDNSQLNSTIFKYGNKTSDNTQETVSGQPNPGDLFQGEFSGDGITDYLYAIKSGTQPGGPGSAYFVYYTQLKTFIKDNVNGGFYGGLQDINLPVNSVKISKDLSANVNSSFLVEDYNGDGKSDIMVLSVPPSSGQPTVSGATIYMSKADEYAGSFLPAASFDPTMSITYPQTCAGWDEYGNYYEYDCSQTYNYNVVPQNGRFIYSADFNGDGLTDVISIFKLYYGSDSKYIFSTPATSSKIIIGGNNTFPIDWSQADNINVIDHNGDGRPDLMITKDGRSITYTFNSSGSASVIYDSGFPTKWHDKILPGDFNGDGKTDLLTRSSNGIWYLSYSKGEYFNDITFPFTATPDVSGSNFRNIQIGDYDGNGLSDVLYLKTNFSGNVGVSRTVDIYFSNGNSFTKKSFTTSDLTGRPEIVGDFNGDGKTDILFRGAYNSSFKIYYFTPDSKNYLLEKVTNGFNITSSIAYLNMTDKSSSASYNNTSWISTYPVNNIRFPMWLASSMTSPNGIGGNTTISYKYKDARLHRKGAGFLGFKTFQIDNSVQDVQSTTEFETLIPQYLTALKKATTKQLSNNTLLSETTNTNSIQVNGNRYWSKVDGTVSNNYLTGATASSSTTYDGNGNMTNTSATVNGEETINTTYDWWGFNAFGSPIGTHTNKTRTGTNSVATISYRNYNTKGDLMNEDNYNYDDANWSWIVSTSTANAYNPSTGTLSSTSLSSSGLATKTTLFEYDSKHRYVTKTTNPLGQFATKIYNPKWGTVATETDIAGLSTYYTYDGFGRLTFTQTPQYHNIGMQYLWSNNTPNLPIKCYDVVTTIPGNPSTLDTYDVFGRKTVATHQNYGGPTSREVYTHILTEYDAKGNVSKSMTPVNATDWGVQEYTTYEYDALNRLSRTYTGIGTTYFGYSYNAGKTTASVTTPAYQTSSKTTEASGKVVSTTDYGGTLTFDYDSRGNQTAVKLSGTVLSSMTYDFRGRQTSLTDKNAGTTNYNYNAYGELIWQKDANANEYTMTYDNLGRLLTRTGPEGVTTNEYVPFSNTFSNYGVNQIKKISGFNGVLQEYIYDNWQRISQAKETIDGIPFIKSFTYNAYNDVATATYPSGLVITNSYSPDGYLYKVQSGSQVLFDGSDAANGKMNGFGKWQTYKLGNGVTTNTTYNSWGMPTTFQAGAVQNLNLNWNLQTGNLNSRADYVKGKTEAFTYDNLNRLTSAQVSGLTLKSFVFAANGNITSKPDVGNYVYDPNRINAVTEVNNSPTPSVIPSFQQAIIYTKFLRPEKLTEAVSGGTYGSGNYELTYTYASDYERRKGVLKVNGSIVNTRLYMGDYEIDTKNGVTREIHYIGGGDGMCSIVVKENGSFNYYFPYTDHLGSILTVTNASGTVVAEQNFDAWGRKRNVYSWDYAGVQSVPDWLYRGYTGHEYLPDFGLINMNARLYDPVLGRMLSPDNFVGEGGTQAFNRYSYANNNPLKFTDPSGNFPVVAVLALAAAITNVIVHAENINSPFKLFGYAAIGAASVYSPQFLAPALGTIGAAITIGGISGGANSALSGGNFWTGAGIGATTSLVGSSLSGAIGGGLGAAVGGAGSTITGNFLTTGKVSWASVAASAIVSYGLYEGLSYWSYRNSTLDISYNQFKTISADYQRSRFWHKEYGGIGLKNGKVIRFHGRHNFGIQTTKADLSLINPNDISFHYHTHWAKEGLNIQVNGDLDYASDLEILLGRSFSAITSNGPSPGDYTYIRNLANAGYPIKGYLIDRNYTYFYNSDINIPHNNANIIRSPFFLSLYRN